MCTGFTFEELRSIIDALLLNIMPGAQISTASLDVQIRPAQKVTAQYNLLQSTRVYTLSDSVSTYIQQHKKIVGASVGLDVGLTFLYTGGGQHSRSSHGIGNVDRLRTSACG